MKNKDTKKFLLYGLLIVACSMIGYNLFNTVQDKHKEGLKGLNKKLSKQKNQIEKSIFSGISAIASFFFGMILLFFILLLFFCVIIAVLVRK